MAAVPMLAGVGIMMVCCSSSSVASLMMGGEEKKVPDGNDAAGEAQAKADAVAADPNSTPEEVTAAQAEADTAQAEAAATPPPPPPPPPPPTPSTFREKVVDGQYPTFAGCWAAAGPGTGSGADKFACCESIGTPYPDYGETGWAYCNDNT